MSHADNGAAPTVNHALIASLLPTIRQPAALLKPDGHTKRAAAQAVVGKVTGLLLMGPPGRLDLSVTRPDLFPSLSDV